MADASCLVELPTLLLMREWGTVVVTALRNYGTLGPVDMSGSLLVELDA